MKLNNRGFAITTIIYGTLILFLLLLVSMLGILATYNDRLGLLIDSNKGARCIINENCEYDISPNPPVLDSGMIPVVISSNGEVKTISKDDDSWYDYNNKKWANVVLVTKDSRSSYLDTSNVVVSSGDILAYYVWIPRYKYKLFSGPVASGTPRNEQIIEIVFESKSTGKSNGTIIGEYLTHPAFTFGDTELSGIWVGKFEATGNNSKPTVLPNSEAKSGDNVSTQFLSSLKFSGSDTYGLTVSTDSHMMKNSEWGAVAYLSHSKYGKGSEVYPNDGEKTGCGSLTENVNTDSPCEIVYGESANYPQSTTGNITGVFDMSGGKAETVMANYKRYSGSSVEGNWNSGFAGGTVNGADVNSGIEFPESKYYDLYNFDSLDDTYYVKCSISSCGGHALYETSGWYDNLAQFVEHNGEVWLARGYFKAVESYGIFNFSKYSGDGNSNDYTWRSVLVAG